jgi:hypothetical protein
MMTPIEPVTRGRVGDDRVGGQRDVVAARGGDVHHDGEDRDLRLLLEESSSLNMMSDAVTVPPVLLIRMISALTLDRPRPSSAPRAGDQQRHAGRRRADDQVGDEPPR